MADPFGFISNQKRGDVSVFDGVQWRSSSYGMNLAANMIGPQAVPLALDGGISSGQMLNIVQGSASSPVTGTGASVFISRYMNDSTAGDARAALWVYAQNDGSSQPAAIFASSKGQGDTVAFYGVARNVANHGAAFGAFLRAEATVSGGSAIGLEFEIFNGTGANHAYTDGLFVGLDVPYDAGGAGNYAGSGIMIRTATTGDKWDAGLRFAGDSIRTASIVDETSAVTFAKIGGTYTNVVDVSAATVSGATWHGLLNADQAIRFSGRIAPAQITSNQNDYNPTGLSTASVLALNSDAARDITGIAGGSNGRLLFLWNYGSFAITLKNNNAGSAAANRFQHSADVTIPAGGNGMVVIMYSTVFNDWRLVSAT